jgi:hypothetical protein
MHKASRTHSQRRLPMLLTFLGLNMLIGAAIGVAFVSVLLLADIGGLKSLVQQSSEPVLPLFLVYIFHIFTFSGVTMGIAVMRLPYDESSTRRFSAPTDDPPNAP